MSNIIIKNSHIEITNYELGQCPRIESQFTLYDRITHSLYPFGMNYNEEDKVLYVPRGVDVWFLEQALQSRSFMDDRGGDPIRNVGDMKLHTAPRDDTQKEVLRFMLGKEEYRNYRNSTQLSVNLRTGGGKTYLAIATMCYYEYASIIITYSTNWLQQWMERALQYTSLPKKDLCYINGSAGINRLFKQSPKHKMYFVTHSTLQSYASQYGWKSIGDLFKHLGIGLKIIDEAHLNFENVSMIDFYTNTYKTYYLTATPARSGEDENMIYTKYFKNVPNIELFDEENDPHTKYIGIKFNSHPSIYDLNECKNYYGLDRNKYIDYLVNKPQFYQVARVIVDLALKSGGKVLIYIGTNAAIRRFYDWFITNYSEYANDIGIFTSLTSKEEKEDIKENKRFILSTTKSAGAAVDIHGLKMTIVLDEPFKSHVIAQQSLGRTRDRNTWYIECVDVGFSHILKYYRYKRPIFEKYAESVSEMWLKDDELVRRNEAIINKRMATAKPLFATQLIYSMDDGIETVPIKTPLFVFKEAL